MALRVDNLHFHYQPGKSVLRGLSARFAPGKVTAIIGPNGSGKSTLLRLLASVLSPGSAQSGTITRDGVPLHAMSPARRAALVGYLPQRPSLSEPLTLTQVVRLGRFARPRHEAAVRDAIEVVGLRDRAQDFFSELSAGQQQRASLARVLAQLAGDAADAGAVPATDEIGEDDPAHSGQIILADEPVSAQDPKHVTGIMEMLCEQARPNPGRELPQSLRIAQPRTVIVILHDFTLAARYADEVLVLSHDGSIAAHGPSGDTLTPAILQQVFQIPFDRAMLVPGNPVSIAVIARGPESR